MEYEVVVVGAGIGGLTTAALLAARGMSVCLLERQSCAGGCAANVEHLGYQFEPTLGLYCGWEEGGIHQQIFSNLPVDIPQVEALSPSYVVRLPDRVDVPISSDLDQSETTLGEAFPECPAAALKFYQGLASHVLTGPQEVQLQDLLEWCSFRFKRFIDLQLQTFAQSSTDTCSIDLARVALNPRRTKWRIIGGAQSLIDALVESIKKSGGNLRLNAPVLRLAYGSDDLPIGVDLLSGERVTASRAIVSNLTVWDTYGKLVGLSNTPPAISSQLRKMSSWGAYVLFLSMNEAAISRLPSDRILALSDWQEGQGYDAEPAQLTFSVSREARDGRLPVTVTAFTQAEDWFSFHQDHSAHEARDQGMLESIWTRLHAIMPELGGDIEVIETATPQTLYETTRRKFGMVGRIYNPSSGLIAEHGETPFPNFFIVSDTTSAGLGVSGISTSALRLANDLSA